MPPTVIEIEEGKFAQACWWCREVGRATPTARPVHDPATAAKHPSKCQDCYQRSLVGIGPAIPGRLDS